MAHTQLLKAVSSNTTEFYIRILPVPNQQLLSMLSTLSVLVFDRSDLFATGR